MVKHTQTMRQQKPTNCSSVFDHFVGLAHKGLNPSNNMIRPLGISNIFELAQATLIILNRTYPFFSFSLMTVCIEKNNKIQKLLWLILLIQDFDWLSTMQK